MAKTESVAQSEPLYTVLVVDDDPAVLGLIGEIVSMIPDCLCLKAPNPAEAMRLMTQGKIDVVITDVHMPGQTGIDMIGDFLHMEYSPEVIVMTAFPSSDIAQNAIDLGASSLISKPFEDVSIIEVELDKAFKRIARRREAFRVMETPIHDVLAVPQQGRPAVEPLSERPKQSPERAASQTKESKPAVTKPPAPAGARTSTAKPAQKQAVPSSPSKVAARQASEPEIEIDLTELELDKGSKAIPRERGAVPIQMPKAPEPRRPAGGRVPEGGKVPAESGNEGRGESEPFELSESDLEGAAPKELAFKIYDEGFLRNIVPIEMSRCDRYKRQFSLFCVHFDESSQQVLELPKGRREQLRDATLEFLHKRLRGSDIMVKRDDRNYIFLAFECNKVGAFVVKQKLMSRVLYPVLIGTATYPTDGAGYDRLIGCAESSQQSAKKLNILIYEEEEFFRSILQNMLSDPKFHVTFAPTAEKAYELVCTNLDSLQLFLLSISKNRDDDLKLLYKIKKENIGAKMKMLIMAETIPARDAIETLKELGVSGMIKKGCSQEEVLHIIHTLIVPKPYENIRRHKRALVTIPVKYRLGDDEYATNTFTLAQGGMFLKDMNPQPPGTVLQVRFGLPGHNYEFSCQAEVVYSIPYFVGVANMHTPGMAVKFLDLPEAEMRAIDEYVNRCYASYFFF